jgi:glycerol-3-phosphate dehydrogenase
MRVALPGADLPGGDPRCFARSMRAQYPALPGELVDRLCRSYGTRVRQILGDATDTSDLGPQFGGGLYAREVDYLVRVEAAQTAEDILFRRTKLGPFSGPEVAARLEHYLRNRTAGRAPSLSGNSG